MSGENKEDIRPAGNRTGAEHPFDALTRRLASNTLSRRQALRLIGGVIVGVTLSSIPRLAQAKVEAQAGNATAGAADTSMTPSDGDSVALSLEAECPPDEGPTCSGECCSPGELCCPAHPLDRCVDPQTDQENCGNCGVVCSGAEICQNGRCECTGICDPPLVPAPTTCQCECPSGTTNCDGDCVNLLTNPNNCGSCGNVCPAGLVCQNGQCQQPCPLGQTRCYGMCVDLQTDLWNCGSCGRHCGVKYRQCCAGVCLDINDRNNCGSCGRVCPANSVCSLVPLRCAPCPSGQSVCGNSCLDLQTDPNNCGSCGNVCPAGLVCQNGQCQLCPLWAPIRCGSDCVNPAFDRNHCGSCFRICAANQTCQLGRCVP